MYKIKRDWDIDWIDTRLNHERWYVRYTGLIHGCIDEPKKMVRALEWQT